MGCLRSLRRGALCAPARPPCGAEPFGGHPAAGMGGGRPLIRHGMRRDTFPPTGGKALGAALEAAPMGCLRSLRRGALCAPTSRPAGRNPLGAILRLGWGEEDPSSVTACAVTPSPRRGEGFGGGSGSRPYGMPFGLCVGARFARPPAAPQGGTLWGPSCGWDGGGRPLIRHGIRRDTFPRWGEGFGGGAGSRPYGMPFGLCTPLRHVTGPGMAGRARLLCKGRNQNSGEDLCLPRPGQRLISRFSVRPRR